MTKLNKNFESAIDKFLEEFDKRHPNRSSSQQAEIEKYYRIGQLRDLPEIQESTFKIWESF